MAYIPKDDDEQNTGMNVLALQNQQQDTSQEGQNQPQSVSGGQSATIGSGSTQQGSTGGSQAPKRVKKAKSGMFSNLRKYIEQNKPGAQRMGGKLKQNISQQNQNIQSAINKQKTDFMSRVNQNRQRMQQAQQFGQQAVQRAQGQEAMPQLQQQQQQTQQRIESIGPIDNQYVQGYAQQQQPQQSFEDYAKQQMGFSQQQQAIQQAQQAYEQAQQAQQQQAQQFAEMIDPSKVIQQDAQASIGRHWGELQWSDPTYYTQEGLNQALMGGDQTAINRVDQSLQADRDLIQSLQEKQGQTYEIGESGLTGQYQLTPEEQAQLEQAQGRLDAFKNYREQVQSAQQAQQAQTGELGRLEEMQSELSRTQEQQRLFQNKQALQQELAGIQDKIQNAPEQLTQEEIDRFNNLRTGIERFDTAILNLSEQRRGVQGLQEQADALQTSRGRRDLMRKEFGAKGGYTSGQAALDNLILTGDPQAMRDLVQGAQQQAQASKQMLDQAYKQGRITQDEMLRGTQQLQESLQSQVDQAQSALQQGLEQRAATGEGTFAKQLQDKIASGQGLSAEELNMLGLENAGYVTSPQDLLQNIQIDPETFGIQDVATQTDVARASALARLAGEGEGENRFLQNQLGLEQDELDRIAQRGVAGEGEDFGTSMAELGATDRAIVEQLAKGSQAQQAQVKKAVNNIGTFKKHERRAANRLAQIEAAGGAGNPEWKYWNHIRVDNQQKAKNTRNRLINEYQQTVDQDNQLKSESQSRYGLLERLGIK